jgi:integrase
MTRRSYGSGRLYSVKHKTGGESWYGTWWAGTVRVKRKLGPKRPAGTSDSMTRVEAERELRRQMLEYVVAPRQERRTIREAGEDYIDHLETVMERKRTTIEDYCGYLNGHFAPFFGKRRIDRIDADHVAAYLRRKLADGYSSKTVQNHLNFLHGIFVFAVKRGWASDNPVALVDRPKSASSGQSSGPAFGRSPFTSCATHSAPRWRLPARRCERFRSGWATPTRRRPRSTGTTRLIRPTARR